MDAPHARGVDGVPSAGACAGAEESEASAQKAEGDGSGNEPDKERRDAEDDARGRR